MNGSGLQVPDCSGISLVFNIESWVLFPGISGRFTQLLRRILRRLPTNGSDEVVVGQLKVMLGRDKLTVAHPSRDDMQREVLGKFCLACAAQVLE